jgi:hypothetical protein
MRSKRSTLALIAASTLVACGGTWVYLQDSDVIVTGKLEKVTHPKWHSGAVVDVVWGNLSIEGANRTLTSADLDCFTLRIGDSVSEKIHVASSASVPTSDYRARDGTVKVDVYWTMKGFAEGTAADLPRARLSLQPKGPESCFEFR